MLSLKLPVKFRPKLLAAALTLSLSPSLFAADLLEVYRDAQKQDAELAVEKAKLAQSAAQTTQASAFLKPQIGASATYSRTDIEDAPEKVNNLNLALEASQMLFNGEVIFSSQAAKAAYQAAEANYKDAEQNLLLRASQAYFDVLLAKANLSSAKAEEEAIKRQLDQAQEQYDVGLIPITNVLEARAAYDGARASRLAREASVLISYENLEQITGTRYTELNELSAQLPVKNPQPNDRQAWVDTALANSLALQAAQAGVEAANKSLTAKRSGHLPEVALFAQYSKDSDTRNPATQAKGYDMNVIGVRANLELYGGGRTQAAIQEGTASLEAALSSQDLAKRQILQQTRSLFTQVSTDVLSIQAHQLAIESAESALEATRTGYEVGTRNIVDVLNAERTLWRAKRDYDAARYGYVINQLSLKRVAGSLALTDLEELNNWLVNN